MTPTPQMEVRLTDPAGGRSFLHLIDPREESAVRAALAARRPLLVRGEPGVGKSELARAAAVRLGLPFLSHVVNFRTEAHDLMASFDAVQRLAQAQVCSALKDVNPAELLAERKFVRPGKLWWAFNWQSAREQADLVNEPEPDKPRDWKEGKGTVLLIDEIDKAESDVPNGLLEALGSRSFPVRGRKEPVVVDGEPPLVVITTNEDRVLPNAFLRRCLVLHLRLPPLDALPDFLVKRGAAHLPRAKKAFLKKAADLLVEARAAAERERIRPLPGQAEYLDMIQAAAEIASEDNADPTDVLDTVAEFVLRKQDGGSR